MKNLNPIQINIPQPCHEDWDKMTPIDQGRFCDSCKKCVVDFRGLSDKAIYKYVLQHKGEHICGRFHSDQMNRQINLPPQPHSRLYRYFAGLGLTLLFTQMPLENLRAKAPFAFIAPDDNDYIKKDKNSIKIHVFDPYDNSAVERVHITVLKDKKMIGVGFTDRSGDFYFERNDTGEYRIEAIRHQYESFSKSFYLTEKTDTDLNVEMFGLNDHTAYVVGEINIDSSQILKPVMMPKAIMPKFKKYRKH